MNYVFLTGRLSKEPQLKYVQGSGLPIAEFDLAVDREYSKNNENNTDFITIYCFNKLAESTVNNLDKGRLVNVIARVKSEVWRDENGKSRKAQKIIAHKIDYLDYPKTEKNELNFEPINLSSVEGELPF